MTITRYESRKIVTGLQAPKPSGEKVSLAAEIERNYATAAKRTLTEIVCGDPLPGRSALDKIRSRNLAEKLMPGFDIKAGLSQ